MRNAAGELAYGFHLLRLQEYRLCLLSRFNLCPKLIVGERKFLGAPLHHFLKVFPVLRQCYGSITKPVADEV